MSLSSVSIALNAAGNVAAQCYLAAFCASDTCSTMGMLERHRKLYWRTRAVVIFDRVLNNEPINRS